MKKTSKNTGMGIALGMCFGVAVGTSLGSSFGNTSIGISIGISVGMLIGLVIGMQKDKRVNQQIEEKCYTIAKIVHSQTDNKYMITIFDKAGIESVVAVPKGQMEGETFAVGDIVFMDDDGVIEQAYDKEDI